jgi:TatD DNase family protein
VGVDVETSDYALEIAEQHSEVFAVVGWHPNYAAKYSSKYLRDFKRMLKHPKVLALGEMGLDSHWNYATEEEQLACLVDQLELACKTKKPIVFHCRGAYPKLLDILEAQPKAKYLFHCFSGNEQDAERAVALDAWFGVDGPITYKKADHLRSVISSLPRDKILLETDSPWMPPHPYRGKPNKPAWLPYINSALAHLWGVGVEECAQLTTQNAVAFFGEELVRVSNI